MEDNSIPLPEPTMVEKYRPSKSEYLRRYPISIKFLDRGVMVTVGCKEIAFESVENFMKSFNTYMDNPGDAQESWEKFFYEQERTK